MQIRADVKCYYCGFVSGQIEGDPESQSQRWAFRSLTGATPRVPSTNHSLRCTRCGGPVFLDEIETVRRSLRGQDRELAGASR